VRVEAKARQLLREEISLHRRDIAKTVAIALEEGLARPWSEFAELFRGLGPMPPRAAEASVLEALASELRALRFAIDKCLEESTKNEKMSANESHSETHPLIPLVGTKEQKLGNPIAWYNRSAMRSGIGSRCSLIQPSGH